MRIEYFGGTHGSQIAKRNDCIGHPLWCAFRFGLQPMAFPDRIRTIGTDLNVHRLCDRQIAETESRQEEINEKAEMAALGR